MKTLLTILLTISLTCQGQDLKYAAVNVVSSSLISGIGSGIHKHKNESFGHAFLNGCWRGAIGGGVQFMSKRLSSQIYHRENYWYGLESRIINSVGMSVVYSGVMNQSIISNYILDFGFIHYQTDFKKNSFALNPCNLIVFVYEFFDKNNEFNVIKTLKTGVLFFDKKLDLTKVGTDIKFGQSVCDVMMVQKYTANGGPGMYFDKYQTASHELIHTIQYENSLNIIVLGNPQKIKFINWDIPVHNALYVMTNFWGKSHNWYENEAYWLSR
jgi:hypothetical protein